jgi:hypothetical protein
MQYFVFIAISTTYNAHLYSIVMENGMIESKT